MSWRESNSTFRTPPMPHSKNNPKDVFWIRYGGSTDNPCRVIYQEESGNWIMAYEIGPGYLPNGSTRIAEERYYPTYHLSNGKMTYFANQVIHCLWYNHESGKWILSDLYEETLFEEWVWNDSSDTSQGGYYTGTNWWEADQLPSGDGEVVSFVGRGLYRGTEFGGFNGETFELAFYWNRWEWIEEQNNPPFGEYLYKGNDPNFADSVFCFGLPQWTDQDGNQYIRSLDKVGNYYTYGSIYYNFATEKWMIGYPGIDQTWWEGSALSKDSQVTFAFKKGDNVSPDVTGENKVFTFDKYVSGNSSVNVLMGQVPIWL